MPWHARDKTGGIIWLPCDHPEDGDYILAQVADKLSASGADAAWVQVSRDDPALIFASLLGEADTGGLLGTTTPGGNILVAGGGWLPMEALGEHGPTVARAAIGGGLSVIWPMHREALQRLRSVSRLGSVARTPSLVRPYRSALRTTLELLAMMDPELRLGPRDDVAKTIASGGTNSRGELRVWIEHYCNEGAVAAVPPPIKRVGGLAGPLITADVLGGIVQDAIAVCQRITDLYEAWHGVKVLSLPHLGPPLPSGEMRSVFVAFVSWLSALFFDAAHPAIRGVVGRLELRDGAISFSVGVPAFLRDLRMLRTYFQHGLDASRSHDSSTFRHVEAWFFGRCGNSTPQRASWRRLVAALLTDCTEFLKRLEEASVRARAAGSAELRAQVELAFREIDSQEWITMFVEEAIACAPHLRGNEVERRRGDKARKELRDCGVIPGREREQARVIVRRHVVDVGAECPLDAERLISAGFRDRHVTVALKYADDLFRAEPRRTAEELLEECVKKWPEPLR